MPDDQPPSGSKWWSFAGRDRYHTYYKPTNNVPGIALFVLIAGLGTVAATVAGLHVLRLGHVVHADAVLGGCGLFVLLIGVTQARALLRH